MLGPEEVTTELISSNNISITERHGLIPRAIVHLFEQFHSSGREDVTASVKCSYTEIYNESINDLLSNPPARNLRIREFPRLGMCIIGVTERFVNSPGEVGECLASGTVNRITGATEMNQRSSRSHTIFTMTVEQVYANGSSKIAKLNLVDLAGSEKISKTGASGKALVEAQNINLSLTTLGRCIKALASSKEEHIPYRESKLTMILKEALGGNAKTALICTASMRNYHVDESLGTLKFAERAKKIQVKARSNVQLSQSELLLLVDKLKSEVKLLKSQLQNRDEAGTPAPRELSRQDEYGDTAGEGFSLQSDHMLERELCISGHFQTHLDRIEEANHMMADLFAEKQQMKVRFESESSDARKRLDAALSEVESLKRESEDSKSLMERFRFEVGLKDASLKNAVSQIRRLEVDLHTAVATIEETRQAISSLSKDNDLLHCENLALHKDLEESRINEAKIQPSLMLMQQQLTQFTKRRETRKSTKTQIQVSASESSLTAIKSMVDDLKERLATRDSQLNEALEVNKKLSQEFSYKEAELQVRLTLAQAEIKSLTKAVCEFAKSDDEKVEFMRPASVNLKPVIAKLMEEMTTLQKEYQAMVERFRVELARTRESYEDRMSDVEKRLAESNERLELEISSNASLRKAAKFMEVEHDSLQFRVKTAKSELSSIAAQLHQEQSQSERLMTEVDALREEMQMLRDEITKVRSTAEEETSCVKKLWLDAEVSLNSQIDTLQLDLVRTKSESIYLTDVLRTKESELKFSSSVIFDLEAKLAFLSLKDQKLDSAIKYFRRKQESVALPVRTSGYSSRSSSARGSIHEGDEAEKQTKPAKDNICLSDIRALYSNAESEDEEDAGAKGYISSLEEGGQIEVQIVEELGA